MTIRISNRDWETMSAYLDGQLSPKERLRLEARLRQDNGLRNALEDLRRTRAVLRSQPKLRAPRNFTLTPEMVGARRGQAIGGGGYLYAFSALRLTSALASLLFVLVLIGDFFGGAPRLTAMENAPLAAQEASRNVQQEAGGGIPTAEAPRPLAGIMPTPQGTSEVSMFSKAAEPSESTTETPAEPAAAMAVPLATTPAEATASADMTAPYVAPEAPPAGQEPALGVSAYPAQEALENPTSLISEPALRILEVTLAVLAIGAGLAAFFLRRAAGP